MFPLRRQTVVLGDDSPAVSERADVGESGIDHRLDGEGHAGLVNKPGTRTSIMQDLRLLVESASDTMTAEFAHHAVSILFRAALDGMADIAEPCAGMDRGDPAPHAFIGDIAQAACLYGRLAHEKHAAGVAVIAILDDGNVKIDDIAGLEFFVTRHAVANHVID